MNKQQAIKAIEKLGSRFLYVDIDEQNNVLFGELVPKIDSPYFLPMLLSNIEHYIQYKVSIEDIESGLYIEMVGLGYTRIIDSRIS